MVISRHFLVEPDQGYHACEDPSFQYATLNSQPLWVMLIRGGGSKRWQY